MVPGSSIEIRGLEVLCVFKAKLCDCADEQTEANDRYTAHRDLGWQPELTNQPNTAHCANGLGEPKTAAHLRGIVGKIPPICFAFSAPTLRPKVFTAFVGFVFFFSLLWKQKSFDSQLSL